MELKLWSTRGGWTTDESGI